MSKITNPSQTRINKFIYKWHANEIGGYRRRTRAALNGSTHLRLAHGASLMNRSSAKP